MIVQMSPSVSFGFPSTISSGRIFTRRMFLYFRRSNAVCTFCSAWNLRRPRSRGSEIWRKMRNVRTSDSRERKERTGNNYASNDDSLSLNFLFSFLSLSLNFSFHRLKNSSSNKKPTVPRRQLAFLFLLSTVKYKTSMSLHVYFRKVNATPIQALLFWAISQSIVIPSKTRLLQSPSIQSLLVQ